MARLKVKVTMKDMTNSTPGKVSNKQSIQVMEGSRFSRRSFLSTAARAGAFLALPQIVPARVLGREGATPPSEQIVLGAIGVGNRGTYVLGCFMNETDVRFVAICDVKEQRRNAIKKKADEKYGNNDCKIYRDLRDLLARS